MKPVVFIDVLLKGIGDNPDLYAYVAYDGVWRYIDDNEVVDEINHVIREV